jgi:hypothetical protein
MKRKIVTSLKGNFIYIGYEPGRSAPPQPTFMMCIADAERIGKQMLKLVERFKTPAPDFGKHYRDAHAQPMDKSGIQMGDE